MDRRQVLKAGAALSAGAWMASARAGDEPAPRIMTVRGPIAPADMGLTLPHEHVIVDFAGAEKGGPDRYDRDEVFNVALPHLKQAHQLGCRTFVDCTPAYLARDPVLLRRLSEASGLHIVTNTGYYGAANDIAIPAHAHQESAAQLAARWEREWTSGIEGTGIRPGFIKIGVDAGRLSEIDRRLVEAAALAHLTTGLTIAAHTGNGEAAMEELVVLRDKGVDASAFIWVHAQNERDPAIHARAAERGAWVEFDGIGPKSIERHLECVEAMKERGLLGRVLISHDAGWYHVGEPRGGNFRPFDTLFTQFLPALKGAGFTEAEIRRMTVDNPQRAFPIGVRTKTA